VISEYHHELNEVELLSSQSIESFENSSVGDAVNLDEFRDSVLVFKEVDVKDLEPSYGNESFSEKPGCYNDLQSYGSEISEENDRY
jgi:hypothetical protein